MKWRPLTKGSSNKEGLEIPELTLGTFGLFTNAYGKVGLETIERTASAALGRGIACFDFAAHWGTPEQKRIFVGGVGPTAFQKSLVILRLGWSAEGKARFNTTELEEDFMRSLRELGRSHADVVIFHRPPENIWLVELMAFAFRQKAEGRLRAFGVATDKATIVSTFLGQGADLVCMPHSLLHNSPLDRAATIVKANGCGLLVHSTLHHGLIGKPRPTSDLVAETLQTEIAAPIATEIPAPKSLLLADELFKEEEARLIREEQMASLSQLLTPHAAENLKEASIRYVLSSPLVSSAIVGCTSPAQVDEMVGYATKGGFPRNVLDAIPITA